MIAKSMGLVSEGPEFHKLVIVSQGVHGGHVEFQVTKEQLAFLSHQISDIIWKYYRLEQR